MSSHRRLIRRQMRLMQKGLQRFSIDVGTTVLWYEFDPARTTTDDTYDEGDLGESTYDEGATFNSGNTFNDPGMIGGLAFRPPIMIPAVWVRYLAPSQIATDQGEYLISHSTLRFASSAMIGSGLSFPLAPEVHINDRYYLQGRLYRVQSYELKGQLYGTAYVMVDVGGTQERGDELQTDTSFTGEVEGTQIPWTPGQRLAWPASQPYDVGTQPDSPANTPPGVPGIRE